MPKATTAGAPKTLPKVFQHEAIMQLLVKGSSNGSITGTEIADAQAEAALDLKQMKPVLTMIGGRVVHARAPYERLGN